MYEGVQTFSCMFPLPNECSDICMTMFHGQMYDRVDETLGKLSDSRKEIASSSVWFHNFRGRGLPDPCVVAILTDKCCRNDIGVERMFSKVSGSTAKGQTTLFQNWGYYGNKPKNCKSTGIVILNEDDPITIDDDLQEVDEEALLAACEQAEGCFSRTNTAPCDNNPTIPLKPDATPLECLPGFDVSAGKIWIYPTNYPVRDYQFSIVAKALQKNTLVTLPTGLGKTFIAAVVMFNFYRWYPQGKVVFMAPTKPLVAQQIEACFNIMGIPQSDMAEMTGSMAPLDRKKTWKVKRVFFLTPQVLTNDLSRQACPAMDVKCLVVDEAHKALGNHAYCEVVHELSKYTPDFRVLALSATPGGDLKAVQQVLNNLLISHVEIRSEESRDIQRYVHERKVEKIVVPLGEELKKIQTLYLQMLGVYVQRLSRAGALFSKDPAHLSKFQLLRAREAFRQDPPLQVQSKGAVEGDFAIGLSLYHGYELLMQHGTRTLYNFLLNTVSEEKGFSRTRQELMRNGDFISVMNVLKEKFEDGDDGNTSLFGTTGNSPISRNISSTQRSKKFVVSHPKMEKLQEIVIKHFRNQESNESSVESSASSSHGVNPPDTRVMIFAQYRDSVQEIAAMLNCHRPLVRCMSFVGQSSAGKATKGISQKEQLRVVKEFRCGNYNTLVSTCVGEEGLDIGDVDLIVCYDAHKSPTRLVQRMGRTGRKRQGRIVMLMTEGKEASIYDKSQYSRRGIHKALQGNSKSLQLYPSSPRMIPRGLNPQPHKMYIKVEQYEGNQKRARGAKKKSGVSISSFMKTGKDKSRKATFLSEEEFTEWSLKYKLNDEETKTMPMLSSSKTFYSLGDARKTKDDEGRSSKQPELSLSSWSLWQTKQQPTHLVSHSVKSKNFVELMEFMEVQDQIGEDDIYGMEMALHFNERDVMKVPSGIQKFMKTNGNIRAEVETTSNHLKSDAEEEKTDSMENVRRSKKRQSLPQLISDESEDEFEDKSVDILPDVQMNAKESVFTETSREKTPLHESTVMEHLSEVQVPYQSALDSEHEGGSGKAESRKYASKENKLGVNKSEICLEKNGLTMFLKDDTSEADNMKCRQEPRAVRTVNLTDSSEDEIFEGDPEKTNKANLKFDKNTEVVHNLVQVLKSMGEKKENGSKKSPSAETKKINESKVSKPLPLGSEGEQVNEEENKLSLDGRGSEVCEEVEGSLSSIFPCSQFSFCLNTPHSRKEGRGASLPPSPPSASALDALDEFGTQVGSHKDTSNIVIAENEKKHCQNPKNICLTLNEKITISEMDKESDLGPDRNVPLHEQRGKGSFERVLQCKEAGKEDDPVRKVPLAFPEEDCEDLFADEWSISAEEPVAPADIQTPNILQTISPSTASGKKLSVCKKNELHVDNVSCDIQGSISCAPVGDGEITCKMASNRVSDGKKGMNGEVKQSVASTNADASLNSSPPPDRNKSCSPVTKHAEGSDTFSYFGLNFDLRFDLDSLDAEDIIPPSPAWKQCLADNNSNGTPASHQTFGQPLRAVSTPHLRQSLPSGTDPSPALTPVLNIKGNSYRRKRVTDTRVDGSFEDAVPPSVRTESHSVDKYERKEGTKLNETENTSPDSPTGFVKSCLLRKLSFCNTDALSTSCKEVLKGRDPPETEKSPYCKKKRSLPLGAAPSQSASASWSYGNKDEQQGQDVNHHQDVSNRDGSQDIHVSQAFSVNYVSDDDPLSQIPKPKKRCKNILRSPEDSSPDCNMTKVKRKEKKHRRKVLLQSSSDEDFDLTSPVNPKSRRKRSSVAPGRVPQSDEDEDDADESPETTKRIGERRLLCGRNGSVKKRFVNQRKRKLRHDGGQRFLDEEAAVSENESISSDETGGSGLDQSLEGFINDATLASQTSPSRNKDMQAVYMKSIRSPATDAILHPNRNRFKMSHGSGFHGNIYSQVPQQDDTYAEDSFVVQGGDHPFGGDHGCFENTINVDNIIGGRGCKRLRNTQGESKAERILRLGRRAVLKSISDDDDDDDDLEVETQIRDKNPSDPKVKGHMNNVKRSQGAIVSEQKTTSSNREGDVRTGSITGGLGHPLEGNGDDEDEGNVRINFDLDFESCVESKSSAVASVTNTISGYTKEQQQREERLRKQKEKQEEFRKKMAAKRKAENIEGRNQCNNRELRDCEAEQSQGFEVTADKRVIVGSSRGHLASCQSDLSSSDITEKQSIQSDKPSILISSKELSSSSSIVSTLAIKHQMDPRVCQLRGCDFMVSMRMGVEKKSLSEFALSSNKAKLVQRLKEMHQLFDKVCIIIEKDRVKRDEKPKPFIRSKYFDSTQAALAKTPIKVLFSDSSDETALILAELAQVEARKGFAINFPRELTEAQEQVFAFCLSIPGTSYTVALSLTFTFPRLVELINCSEANLRKIIGISEERARNIFRHFRHEFDEQMMSTPKR